MALTLPDVLAAEAKAGDVWALDELVRFHHRGLAMLANRFGSVAQSMTFDDLWQEAAIAMIELLPSWQPGAGASFSSYFFSYVPHRIRRRMDYADLPVRLPAYAGVKGRRAYRDKGEATLPFSVCLYKPSIEHGGDSGDMIDEVEATSTCVDYEQRDQIRFAMSLVERLPKREAAVVRLVTLGDQTCEQVASQWGVSRQCIHALHSRAVKRLQAMAKRMGAV